MARQCYFCKQPIIDVETRLFDSFTCHSCQLNLQPTFQLLPDMPNIEIGGYFYVYSDQIRHMIRDIKFHGNMLLAKRFSNCIQTIPVPDVFFDSDVVVPISTHWFRQLWRGRAHIPLMFQQLLLSCDRVEPKLLKRTRYSKSSFKLSKLDRMRVSKRFDWRGGDEIRSVTLIDDICTTGSTVIEIARLLKDYGVGAIRVLVGAHVEW